MEFHRVVGAIDVGAIDAGSQFLGQSFRYTLRDGLGRVASPPDSGCLTAAEGYGLLEKWQSVCEDLNGLAEMIRHCGKQVIHVVASLRTTVG